VAKISAAGLFLFFPAKKSAGGEGMPMSGVKRLNRLSASTAREAVRLKVSGRQLPARRQDQEMIEAWKLIKSLL
jgi:hypothetical protein